MFISSAYAQTAQATVEKVAEHESGNFPPFDFSYFASHIFWLIICFGLFYLFISRVIVPRIGGVIETRRDRIASDLDEAARLNKRAEDAVEAYEENLAKARSRAQLIVQSASDEVKVKMEAARKYAEAELDVKLKEAEARISTIREKAMQGVGAVAEEVTVDIIAELLDSPVSAAKVAAAVKSVRE